MLRIVSRILFWINGWSIEQEALDKSGAKSFILIGAPHTSNWDTLYFIATIYHLKLKVKFLIKKQWMFFPFTLMFKPLGAIGVNREKSENMVDFLRGQFSKYDDFIVAISPEGTRSKNPKWKSGFYYTAVEAKVPIALGFLDYKTKIAGIGKIIEPSGDIISDFEIIANFYDSIEGKYPEKYASYKPGE